MRLDGTLLSLDALELPRLEAVIELMFLAAYADNTIKAEERSMLWEQVVSSAKGRLSRETIEAMLAHIEAALAQEGREARFESIKRRLGDSKTRAAALATAAGILHADNIVDAREAAWLVRAAQALEVPLEEALALLAPRGHQTTQKLL